MMDYPEQETYDVMRNGRFVGRIRTHVAPGEYSKRFVRLSTFEEWTSDPAIPMPVVEIPLKGFMNDNQLVRVFDASDVPLDTLERIAGFIQFEAA